MCDDACYCYRANVVELKGITAHRQVKPIGAVCGKDYITARAVCQIRLFIFRVNRENRIDSAGRGYLDIFASCIIRNLEIKKVYRRLSK